MAENLFEETPSEGTTLDIDKAFERLDSKGETPSEALTEKQEEKAPDSSKDSGKWAELRREAKAAKAEAAKAREEVESLKKGSQPIQVPTWFSRLKFQQGKDIVDETDEQRQARFARIVAKDGELDWIKQSVLSDLEQKQQQEQAVTKAGEEYVDAQLGEMTDEGLKFERNELLKFMVDFQKEFGPGSLLDAEGNYDFRKALKLMDKFTPEEEQENVNKTLASQASKSKVTIPTTSQIPVVSRRTLRRGWRDAGI